MAFAGDRSTVHARVVRVLSGIIGGLLIAGPAVAAQAEPAAPASQGVTTSAPDAAATEGRATRAGKRPPEAGKKDSRPERAGRKAATTSTAAQRKAAGRKDARQDARRTKPAPRPAAPESTPAPQTLPAATAEAEARPRPALVVDGASAPQVPDAARPAEIEVRVSATQRRENAYRGAVSAIGEGRVAEGIAQLQQILDEHPGHDNARQTLIGLALRSKQFARAEALADDRLAHGDEHLGFAVVSARLKLDRADPVAALDVLKRSEAHARSNPDYQALMAAVLQRLSRHAEAAERFRMALVLQPGTAIWQMGLGVSLQALDRTAEALDAYKRARDATGLTPELRAFVDQRVAELQR